MLREAERHDEDGVKQPEDSAGEGRHHDTEPQIATLIDGEPAGKGADRHDAFDAEIEDAGAFRDELAQGREDERRGNADGRCPQGCRKQDLDRVHDPISSASGSG